MRALRKVRTDCRFLTLADLRCEPFEKWLTLRTADGEVWPDLSDAALAASALALSACDTMSSALGIGKMPPDEYAVAPLL